MARRVLGCSCTTSCPIMMKKKSSQWLKIAANNGHATAQYRLYVELQEQGETKEANEWLQKLNWLPVIMTVQQYGSW